MLYPFCFPKPGVMSPIFFLKKTISLSLKPVRGVGGKGKSPKFAIYDLWSMLMQNHESRIFKKKINFKLLKVDLQEEWKCCNAELLI